jgi:hypothetical protein
MLDEKDLMLALKRHWDYSGKDEDIAHEIYHEDAVLEFPQSGERFEGVENFREWRRQYPAHLAFYTRRISHCDDLAVVENLISYNGAPWMYTVNLLESETTKSHASASTSWMAGKRPSGGHLGGPIHSRIHRSRRSNSSNSLLQLLASLRP